MTCQIENSGKILSVCFDDRTAAYRFGAAGQAPELELSEPIASLDYTPWPGVGRSIWERVVFRNNSYTYEVSGGYERPFGEEEYEDVSHRNFGVVTVNRDGIQIAILDCARETVDFTWGGLFDAKNSLGFVWDYDNHRWHELPD